MRKKIKITKESFKLLVMKSQKHFTVIVSKMRVVGQKKLEGGAPNAHPSLYRVKGSVRENERGIGLR